MRGIVAVVIVLAAATAWGNDGQVNLRGIPSMIVTVVNRSDGTGSCSASAGSLESWGIHEAAVLAEARYKLRKAGVKIPEFVEPPPGTPVLTIGLAACGKNMNVDISLWESVTVRGMVVQAITWSVGGGNYGGTAEAYQATVRDGVTSFLNAWLRDNK